MAMDAGQLKNEILTAMEACGWNTGNEYSQDVVQCLANAIATAVVNHIQDNAKTSVDNESIL